MVDVWKNALKVIEQQVSHVTFITYFKNTEYQNLDDQITILAPNIFIVKQLQTRYNPVICSALQDVGVEVKNIQYEVNNTSRKRTTAKEPAVEKPTKPTAARELVSPKTDSGPNQNLQTGLNTRYLLSNFVIGSNNDLAVSVAKAVIDHPGEKNNPFFLYGGPGLGKTHLVQAIGNELLARHPKMKILYTPTSRFYTDFINSIKNGKGDEFSTKFRKLDVLIIDDFQMIVKKDRSQEEFFNIFNDLYQLNKQIIVTSDRLPSQIETVDERLASRLTWAGAIDLQMPDFEDRCAILKSKAEYQGIEIEDAAIEYIADNTKTNIRDLESELSRIVAIAELKGISPLEVINSGAVRTPVGGNRQILTPKGVTEKVAKFYNLTVKEMCGRSRVSHIKTARQITMYLLSKELGMSTTKIASEVGVKDHTTVMHGIKKIEGDLKSNFPLREQVATLREQIYE